MKKVYVLVEGQTEETFAKEVLYEHLIQFNIYLRPIIVKTKRVKGGSHYRGGVNSYSQIKKDLTLLKGDTSVDLITTMLDLYALPKDFPGYDQANQSGVEKALFLEEQLRTDINDSRFLPYIQVHEFEALLFSSPQDFHPTLSKRETSQLVNIAKNYSSPEEINETSAGAPSKRILSVTNNSYQKVTQGASIIKKIPLAQIRSECLHFDSWVTELEKLR